MTGAAGACPPAAGTRVPLFLGLAAAVVLLFVVPIAGGQISLGAALAERPWSIGTASSPDALIFWNIRLPRVLLGLLVGGGLAVAGAAFQAVLRNPLAEPYVLGVATGASLGRLVAAFAAGWLGSTGLLLVSPLACFAGALLPIWILERVAARTRRLSPATLLLAGVMVNVILSAVILLATYFLDFTRVRQVQLWGLGGLDIVGYAPLLTAVPLAGATLLFIWSHGRALNLFSFDPVTAAHLGVDVRAVMRRVLWGASLLTAAVVAVSGPIGFVGLVVPHGLRQMVGADNRRLIPLSAVWGGVFLVGCDFIGWRGLELLQRIGVGGIEPVEIPVGVITALLGGPVFLWLLVRGERESIQ